MTPDGRILKLTPRVLIDLIGADHARVLMERCGGKRVPNVTPARRERELRRAEVLATLAHHTYRETADILGLPLSTVESLASR